MAHTDERKAPMSETEKKSSYDLKQDSQLRSLLSAQEDVWRVFRVMAEFVDGFTLLAKQENLVSVFGSARSKPVDHSYEL